MIGRGPLNIGDLLLNRACQFFGVDDPEEVFCKTRAPNVTLVRWALSYVLNTQVGWGKQKIAKFLSKDKSSIIYAIRQAQGLYRTSPVFHEAIQQLEEEIFGDTPL